MAQRTPLTNICRISPERGEELQEQMKQVMMAAAMLGDAAPVEDIIENIAKLATTPGEGFYVGMGLQVLINA